MLGDPAVPVDEIQPIAHQVIGDFLGQDGRLASDLGIVDEGDDRRERQHVARVLVLGDVVEPAVAGELFGDTVPVSHPLLRIAVVDSDHSVGFDLDPPVVLLVAARYVIARVGRADHPFDARCLVFPGEEPAHAGDAHADFHPLHQEPQVLQRLRVVGHGVPEGLGCDIETGPEPVVLARVPLDDVFPGRVALVVSLGDGHVGDPLVVRVEVKGLGEVVVFGGLRGQGHGRGIGIVLAAVEGRGPVAPGIDTAPVLAEPPLVLHAVFLLPCTVPADA